ncbi:MAG: hypothetical protein QXE67_02135 [Nitrososphaerota archaeon]
MVLIENISLGLVFTLYWLMFLTGGVLLLLLVTYIIRRVLSTKPKELEEKAELEEVTEEDLELVAGLSAVFATLSKPTEISYRVEMPQPSTSLWKISSILYSSRLWEGG